MTETLQNVKQFSFKSCFVDKFDKSSILLEIASEKNRLVISSVEQKLPLLLNPFSDGKDVIISKQLSEISPVDNDTCETHKIAALILIHNPVKIKPS